MAKKVNLSLKNGWNIRSADYQSKMILRFDAFNKKDTPYSIQVDLDDWQVAELAKTITKYLKHKELVFIQNQQRLREALNYSNPIAIINYQPKQ